MKVRLKQLSRVACFMSLDSFRKPLLLLKTACLIAIKSLRILDENYCFLRYNLSSPVLLKILFFYIWNYGNFFLISMDNASLRQNSDAVHFVSKKLIR
jgi:hypothetical protein